MPSYWPIKNGLVQILHCFACDTGINYVFFFSLSLSLSLQHSIHVKSMLRKRKIQTKTTCFLLENMGNKTNLDRNTPFFCQCLDQTRQEFPIKNPQNHPAPTAQSPRTPLAPSMDRSVLVAEIALSSGNLCTSRWAFRADRYIWNWWPLQNGRK